MKNKITIGVVTWIERKDLIENLLKSIRSYNDDVDILVAVNAVIGEEVDDDYRKYMLNLCSNIKNCYPIFCTEFKSLPKLWNTLVIFSKTKYNLILSDDVIFSESAVEEIQRFIEHTGNEFFTINYQFAHFVVTKNILHQLGYFDERLLTHGEEDGDMVHRHIEMFGKRMDNLNISSVKHFARYEDVQKNTENHIYNKPLINKKIRELKYSPNPTGIKGMWDEPMVKIWEDYQQYPYEKFILNNNHNIFDYKKIIEEY